ncbi:organic solute transporter alpha-like protein [Epargyreus clarus]|uniref:organic solute transporter alpha-like protein n=1 Tax=Epargyreus clarus TaxID=520877 RepID=UPI003C2FC8CC
MDVLSEASEETRYLTARHISSEKPLPVHENAINNSTLSCYDYSIEPDFISYLTVLQTYAWVLWSFCFLLLVAICAIYTVTLRSARKHWRDSFTSLAVVLIVYPVVAATAFITVVVPRARVLSEALAQQVVMVAMYHLFCLFIAECGGIKQLVRRAEGSKLETRVLPCCCWPCCVIPRPAIQQRNLTWLRYLVLQMSFVQAFIYIILLILRAEDMMVYTQAFVFVQFFIAASILSGVWGMIMCVHAVQAASMSPRPRFLALQLVLIIVKLQCGFVKILSEKLTLPCVLELHPSVFVNLIQNVIMIGEMFLLSLWAWRLYRVHPGKSVTKVQNIVVAVIEDNPNVLDVKIPKEGIDNHTFNNNKNDVCTDLNKNT